MLPANCFSTFEYIKYIFEQLKILFQFIYN